MDEIIRLATECIKELIKMSPEEIENFRQEALKNSQEGWSGRISSLTGPIMNYVCDYALQWKMSKAA